MQLQEGQTAFRVSYFFQQQADLLTGWSMNFWNTLADASAVEQKMLDLKEQLDVFCGYGTYMTYARISDLTGFRQAKIIRFNVDPNPPTSGPEYSDYPDTAVLVKLLGPNKVVVNQWIRGIREGALASLTGKLTLRGSDVTKFNAIAAQLTSGANGWKLRVRDGNEKLKDVVSITDEGIVTVPAHLYKACDQVRIQRCKGFTYPNKLWKIKTVTPDAFGLIGWNPPTLHGPYEGSGLVRRQLYIFVPIQGVKADRASSHDSGRPFGLRGGRRKTRAK